jgi:hypothetical protein
MKIITIIDKYHMLSDQVVVSLQDFLLVLTKLMISQSLTVTFTSCSLQLNPIANDAMDFSLRCNSLKCRAELKEKAVVTTCS